MIGLLAFGFCDDRLAGYLALFPNARYFLIGMGTNDLGTWNLALT